MHHLLKKKIRLSCSSSQAFLLSISPILYGIFAFLLGLNTLLGTLSTVLIFAVLILLIIGLFLCSLKYLTCWAIIYLPTVIISLCASASIAYYLNYVRRGVEPDPFLLSEPLSSIIGLAINMGFYIWLAVPIMIVFSVGYHRFIKNRLIHLHKDTWFIIMLLTGAAILIWGSMVVLSGVVASAD